MAIWNGQDVPLDARALLPVGVPLLEHLRNMLVPYASTSLAVAARRALMSATVLRSSGERLPRGFHLPRTRGHVRAPYAYAQLVASTNESNR
jgi:hypothetical protein